MPNILKEVTGEEVKVVHSKHFYEFFVKSKKEQPLSIFRLKNRYNLSDAKLHIARRIMINTSIDTRNREFQFKVLNNILFFNYRLFKMKIKESPECSFGCKDYETLEHALWQCSFTKSFWNELILYMPMVDFSNLDEKTVIVGFLEKH